jgi:hypothetical protein
MYVAPTRHFSIESYTATLHHCTLGKFFPYLSLKKLIIIIITVEILLESVKRQMAHRLPKQLIQIHTHVPFSQQRVLYIQHFLLPGSLLLQTSKKFYITQVTCCFIKA